MTYPSSLYIYTQTSKVRCSRFVSYVSSVLVDQSASGVCVRICGGHVMSVWNFFFRRLLSPVLLSSS